MGAYYEKAFSKWTDFPAHPDPYTPEVFHCIATLPDKAKRREALAALHDYALASEFVLEGECSNDEEHEALAMPALELHRLGIIPAAPLLDYAKDIRPLVTAREFDATF